MKTRPFIIVLLCILIGGTLLYMARGPLSTEMNALKLIPQSERFTELYFENSSALPRTAATSTPTSFTFTIHNLEGVTTTYPYAVYFEFPGGTRNTFVNSSVILNDGATSSITFVHTFTTAEQTGKVVVDLTGRNQQIDFLVPNNN